MSALLPTDDSSSTEELQLRRASRQSSDSASICEVTPSSVLEEVPEEVNDDDAREDFTKIPPDSSQDTSETPNHVVTSRAEQSAGTPESASSSQGTRESDADPTSVSSSASKKNSIFNEPLPTMRRPTTSQDHTVYMRKLAWSTEKMIRSQPNLQGPYLFPRSARVNSHHPMLSKAISTIHCASTTSASRLVFDDIPESFVDKLCVRCKSEALDRKQSKLQSDKKEGPNKDAKNLEKHGVNSTTNAMVKPTPTASGLVAERKDGPSNLEAGNVVEVVPRTVDQILLKKELCLYPLSLLLFVVLVTVTMMVTLPKHKSLPSFTGRRLSRACTSLRCLQDANYLDNLLSWDTEPCDNFYMFVCSRWTNQFPLAGGNNTISFDDDYAGMLEDQMYGLLQNESVLHPMVVYLRNLFGQCVDVKKIEEAGWDALLDLLYDLSLEGFPRTPPVRNSVSVWKIAAKLLRKAGAAPLLKISVASHPSKAGKDIVKLSMPECLISLNGMDVNSVIHFYTVAVDASVRALRKEFIPPVHIMNIITFASELEKLCQDSWGDSVSHLQKLGPSSPFHFFVTEFFSGVSGAVFNGQTSEILVESSNFVNKLLELIDKTDPHTVINFLGVRLMVQTSPFLPESELLDVYSSLLYGKLRTGVPRRKLCLRVVEKALSPLFQATALTYLSPRTPDKVFHDLVDEIVQQFVNGTGSVTYLNDASRTVIGNLISKTQFKVLGPSWIRDRALLDNYIRSIPPTSSEKWLESFTTVHEYTLLSYLSHGSSERWSHSFLSTNCWYERNPRTVYVPALLFNLTLSSYKQENPFHLSRTGVRVAQCIFDMLFLEADTTDSSAQWLDEDTRSKIAGVQRCFGEPGESQQMSSLRDASAVHFAHGHFRKLFGSSNTSLSLNLAKDHEMSPEQLFFVYVVLQTCEKREGRMKTTPSSGLSWNLALRNEGGFQRAFHCASGSYMNPIQECAIENSR